MFNSDPCAGSPTLTVGSTTELNAGDCSTQNHTVRTAITLSAALPTGYTLERRVSFSTSATPSYGSWADSGLTDTGNFDYDTMLLTSSPNANPSNTWYYDIQFRITGTNGTAVCDGPDTATQWSATLYDCTA
jgi:hypothetical protein